MPVAQRASTYTRCNAALVVVLAGRGALPVGRASHYPILKWLFWRYAVIVAALVRWPGVLARVSAGTARDARVALAERWLLPSRLARWVSAAMFLAGVAKPCVPRCSSSCWSLGALGARAVLRDATCFWPREARTPHRPPVAMDAGPHRLRRLGFRARLLLATVPRTCSSIRAGAMALAEDYVAMARRAFRRLDRCGFPHFTSLLYTWRFAGREIRRSRARGRAHRAGDCHHHAARYHSVGAPFAATRRPAAGLGRVFGSRRAARFERPRR